MPDTCGTASAWKLKWQGLSSVVYSMPLDHTWTFKLRLPRPRPRLASQEGSTGVTREGTKIRLFSAYHLQLEQASWDFDGDPRLHTGASRQSITPDPIRAVL
ncbi:hypothetical protein RRG08_017789 [Elysia crispata]|uniref:Uncharacterized protein n=1 Tax=Elysia crispata TaxID=231223 RepID=A0AAE0ZS67_9GAST|nr:hypothetical protein RRG08_017789 [Elysia crispata]